MKIVATLMAVALVAAATLVLAEEPAKAPRHGAALERLKAADKNGDGLISREEAEASLPRLAKHFDEIDTNKDGQISREEMRAFHEARMAERGKRRPAQSGDAPGAAK